MAWRSSSTWAEPAEPLWANRTTAFTAGSSPAFCMRFTRSLSVPEDVSARENSSSSGTSLIEPARRKTAMTGLFASLSSFGGAATTTWAAAATTTKPIQTASN